MRPRACANPTLGASTRNPRFPTRLPHARPEHTRQQFAQYLPIAETATFNASRSVRSQRRQTAAPRVRVSVPLITGGLATCLRRYPWVLVSPTISQTRAKANSTPLFRWAFSLPPCITAGGDDGPGRCRQSTSPPHRLLRAPEVFLSSPPSCQHLQNLNGLTQAAGGGGSSACARG